MDRAELDDLIERSYPDASAGLKSLAIAAAALDLSKSAEPDIPIGTSKLGGAPDLPSGTPWPMCKARRGHKPEGHVYPLTFVAQFRFSELAPFLKEDLIWPSEGLLAFFFDSVLHCPKHGATGLIEPANTMAWTRRGVRVACSGSR
jgi:hypothetical protein